MITTFLYISGYLIIGALIAIGYASLAKDANPDYAIATMLLWPLTPVLLLWIAAFNLFAKLIDMRDESRMRKAIDRIPIPKPCHHPAIECTQKLCSPPITYKRCRLCGLEWTES